MMVDPGARRELKPPPRPRWIKVSAILAAVVFGVLIVVALMGGHGPARHIPGNGERGGHTPPAGVPDHD